MHQKVIEFNQKHRTENLPDVQTGDVVKIHRKIKEGEKERTQIFEGMVIAKKGGQSSSPTLTVRKVSSGVGVELVVPMLASNVQKIEIVKRAKIRRSKLYYIRDKAAKALRFKFTDYVAPEKPAEEKDEDSASADVKEEAKKEDEPIATTTTAAAEGTDAEENAEATKNTEEKKAA